MAQRVSRRKISQYAAEQLIAGQPESQVLTQVAAYLVATRRTREQELVVRDIESALQAKGLVVADVVSAHPMSEGLYQHIQTLTGAQNLQVRATVDPSMLGGLRVDTPGARFDGTIRRKLNALKAQQL